MLSLSPSFFHVLFSSETSPELPMQLCQCQARPGLGTERGADVGDPEGSVGGSVSLLNGPGPLTHPEKTDLSSGPALPLSPLNLGKPTTLTKPSFHTDPVERIIVPTSSHGCDGLNICHVSPRQLTKVSVH